MLCIVVLLAQYNMRRKWVAGDIAFQQASPYWRAHPDGIQNETLNARGVPTIMIVHGTLDTLVPIKEAHEFWKALKLRREREAEIASNIEKSHDQQQQQQQQAHKMCGASGSNQRKRSSSSITTTTTTTTTTATKPCKKATPTAASDVIIELPGTHHAFNFLLSPRTLAFGDAVVDFLQTVYQTQRPAMQSPKL
jgi:hypothetical protein